MRNSNLFRTKGKQENKKKIDKLQSFKPQKFEFLSKRNKVKEEEEEEMQII